MSELIVFLVAGAMVLAGALGVVLLRHPVHAALSLVGTLFGVAVLFVAQDAHFLAAVQVIVYTGAIVVLILFVLMLLGVDRDEDVDDEPLVGQRTLAAVAAVAIFVLVFGVFVIGGTQIVTGTPNCTDGQIVVSGSPYEPACEPVDPRLATVDDGPNINQIGRVLFTDYVFAFEITAALLTIAVVGAVLLARRPKDLQPIPEPEDMGYEDVDDIETDAEENA